MWMRGLSLIVLVFIFGSGLSLAKAVTPSIARAHRAGASAEFKQRTDSYPFFDHVYVDAPVNVTLHTGHQGYHVTLQGEAGDLEQMQTAVKNGVLYVTLGQHHAQVLKPHLHYGHVNINIETQTLRGLTYRGKGTVIGHGIRTQNMDVWIKNPKETLLDGQIDLNKLTVIGDGYTQISGVSSQNLAVKLIGKPKVQLTGMAAMTSLDMQGKGMFSFYWVKGNALIVRARQGARIQLAGITELLDVELWGGSRFNGRYLRATRTFVKTHDHALAELMTTSRQHTLALDASDIYFYNLSPYRTDYMAQNGAVLDMRDWELEMAQEYTNDNK